MVERASGVVLVKKRGAPRFSPLGAARAVPVGSSIDATNGRVKLSSTKDRAGRIVQSGHFSGGAFTVTQKRSSRPLTDLELIGGSFAGCDAALRRTGVFAARRTIRRLSGSARGRFRTRGRYGSATVRGTRWLTEDVCEGTMALDRTGKVLAESRDLAYELGPGQSVIFHCNVDGVPDVVGLYCLAVLSQPADNIFGYGIAAETPDDQYELCIRDPDGASSCEPFPFHPETDGFRAGGVGCLPAKAGDHYVSWRLRGTDLPVPLPFQSRARSDESFCVSDPPRPGIDPP